ncbi:BQ2448_6985 [Microbotryum intermedium]|uniref:BQ2448_6985 protein n=1 Tax=Microbotryum intermedium TaxID=269621 RepID=A0A238FGX0_9BASI|nr:BQ2448_6985 [Microbotryum intermedium]
MATQPLQGDRTRLIVTNLSRSVLDAHLRQHVLLCPPSPPELTDVKVLQKPDGTSRRLAFLGFKSHQDADRVLAWLQHSWVPGARGGARVKVDWAQDTREAPPPRKKARLSREEPTMTSASPMARDTDDARLLEFMSVMAPRRNRAVESSDITAVAGSTNAVSGKSQSKAGQGSGHELELKPGARVEVRQSFSVLPRSSLHNFSHNIAIETDKTADGGSTIDGAAQDEAISDQEYLSRRMTGGLREPVSSGAVGSLEWEQAPLPEQAPSGAIETQHLASVGNADLLRDILRGEQATASLLEHGRLFLRNLSYSVAEQDLRDVLGSFGEISELHIPIDFSSKLSKGFAHVRFTAPDRAVEAYRALDGRSFQGRLLHIIPGAGNRSDAADFPHVASSVRHGRLEARKATSASGLDWATLYMNSDAVVTSVADRLGLSKATLLDPTADNAAVRMALAETHVISETKQYFQSAGVDLSSFASRGPRSTTTILVKNIPYGTSAAVLNDMFAPFGSVPRLLLPPSGTMAIVQMGDASSASTAWRQLAYKKLGSSVLYLEKAPAGLWAAGSTDTFGDNAPNSCLTSISVSGSSAKPVAPVVEPSDAAGAADGCTLFVKNLAFATRTEALRASFEHLQDFLFARVQTKPDPTTPGRSVSMGFGFVGFRTPSAAQHAKAVRDGLFLDGHQLELRFAHRGGDDKSSAATPEVPTSGHSTTLLVKNLPFEITQKQIRELFSAHGQVRSVRLPRKLDRKTRGFAFVDFATHREAESALAALEHTHLLGRHLPS